MRRTAIAALLATVALAGCGGESDKEKIQSTVRDYFTAFASGDYEKACSQLAEQTREQLVEAARVKDCSTALQRGAQRAQVERFRGKLRDVSVASVTVHDNTATAKVRALGVTTEIPLTKEGDSWKVQGPAGEEGD
jgi:ketosteroid isomerase-like protein